MAREPRTPTAGLPATTSWIAAEEAYIARALRVFRNLAEEDLNSEASHRLFESYFLFRLQNSDDALEPGAIVDVARRGHPPADRALRHYIQICSEARRLDEMPTSIIDYLRRDVAARPPLPDGYSSTTPRVVDHFARDAAIAWMVRRIKVRFPAVPLLYSSKQRRSAAAMVGEAFGFGEARARRIYQTDGELADKIGDFFADYTSSLNDAVVFAPPESFP
jgi:hypothetical protein